MEQMATMKHGTHGLTNRTYRFVINVAGLAEQCNMPCCSSASFLLKVRTTIEAKLMRPEFLVEVDVVAAIAK